MHNVPLWRIRDVAGTPPHHRLQYRGVALITCILIPMPGCSARLPCRSRTRRPSSPFAQPHRASCRRRKALLREHGTELLGVDLLQRGRQLRNDIVGRVLRANALMQKKESSRRDSRSRHRGNTLQQLAVPHRWHPQPPDLAGLGLRDDRGGERKAHGPDSSSNMAWPPPRKRMRCASNLAPRLSTSAMMWTGKPPPEHSCFGLVGAQQVREFLDGRRGQAGRHGQHQLAYRRPSRSVACPCPGPCPGTRPAGWGSPPAPCSHRPGRGPPGRHRPPRSRRTGCRSPRSGPARPSI